MPDAVVRREWKRDVTSVAEAELVKGSGAIVKIPQTVRDNWLQFSIHVTWVSYPVRPATGYCCISRRILSAQPFQRAGTLEQVPSPYADRKNNRIQMKRQAADEDGATKTGDSTSTSTGTTTKKRSKHRRTGHQKTRNRQIDLYSLKSNTYKATIVISVFFFSK